MPESLLPGQPHCATAPVVIAESVSSLLRTLHADDSWSSVVSSAVVDRLHLVDSLADLLSHQCRDSVGVDSCKLVAGDADPDSADKAVNVSDDVIETDVPSGIVFNYFSRCR